MPESHPDLMIAGGSSSGRQNPIKETTRYGSFFKFLCVSRLLRSPVRLTSIAKLSA